jgi:GrpB-like predicted nucleotidyltransferase (UPF0157 family)
VVPQPGPPPPFLANHSPALHYLRAFHGVLAMTGVPKDPVRVVPYDPSWPEQFETERARVAASLGELPARVEHIGSTAVPGLAAKPIVDVMVGRPSGSELAPYVEALRGLGYDYRGENGLPGRHYFKRADPRPYHLHLVVLGGDFWRTHLLFRDALRQSPRLALEYERLKRDLAARHGDDRLAYTSAKGPFITGVLRTGLGVPES